MGSFGSLTNGSWDGMVGELLRRCCKTTSETEKTAIPCSIIDASYVVVSPTIKFLLTIFHQKENQHLRGRT
ncbi:hypothetical protein EGR_05033 [Echinococcus granulosus]|uniref:Ionotropic glutamate receptor L-glutamate and glycine-binding domain-containing protein n=1 Tax=Echinococcus granulosus TaxID=6210 RepID=W6UFH8_ECHGR|nr:hypothetical protein EGR_05033 [Echinococcus granulosus]EUB60180.1 hypothetical protein EGR_05033 [Echinococcus granulosus]